MYPALTHFAINTDHVAATQEFYRSVFGWRFREYGPPGFVQILDETGHSAIGAIQQRRRLLTEVDTYGFECTIGVDDVEETRTRILAGGGRIAMEKFTIAGVGHLIAYVDPGGNAALAMAYDDRA